MDDEILEKCIQLRDAAANGDSETIRTLLADDVDVNSCDILGRTSLHLASLWDNCEVVEALLEGNADVNIRDSKGRSPLHEAVLWRRKPLVELFLKHNDTNINLSDNEGWSALHFAVKNGDMELVQNLLDNGGDIKHMTNNDWSLVHLAAKYGHNRLLQYFLDIHESANDVHVVYMRMHVVDINKICQQHLVNSDTEGRTPLHLASAHGHIENVKFLLSFKVNASATDQRGQTALHHAAAGGYTKVTAYLLNHSTSLEARDKAGETPLHAAAKAGRTTTVFQLLNHGANLESPNLFRQTPLHLAVDSEKLNVIQALVDKRANPLTRDLGGKTTLDVARKRKSEEVLTILERSAFKINQLTAITQPTLTMKQDLKIQYFKNRYTRETQIYPLNQLKDKPGIGLVKGTGEVNLITQGVTEFVDTLIGKFKERNCSIKDLSMNRHILAGSNAEHSKTSAPDEFDYVVAFRLKGSSSLIRYKGHGYAEVIYPLLDCTEFHTWFWEHISDILQDQEFVKASSGRLSLIANVDHGHQDGKACSTFKLRWKGLQFRDLLITVDLVPIIEVCSSCKFLEIPESVQNYFLVPKPPHRESPLARNMDSKEWNQHWRLSFVDTENQKVAGLLQSLRDVYITCKCIRSLVPELHAIPTEEESPNDKAYLNMPQIAGDILPAEKFISSYMMKVVCLREIEAFAVVKSLEDMVLMVFTKLVEHLEGGSLSNYWEFQDGPDDLFLSSKRPSRECLPVARLLLCIAQKLVEYKEEIGKVIESNELCTWNDILV